MRIRPSSSFSSLAINEPVVLLMSWPLALPFGSLWKREEDIVANDQVELEFFQFPEAPDEKLRSNMVRRGKLVRVEGAEFMGMMEK